MTLRLRLLPLLLALAAAGVRADADDRQTFDVVTYAPPPGWTAAADRDHLTFSRIDRAARTYVMLALYASTARGRSPGEDFVGEWTEIVENNFHADAIPAPTAGRTTSGLEYLEGAAAVTQGDARSLARLLVFTAGPRRFSLVILASNEAAVLARAAEVRAFLDSLAVPGAAAPAAAPDRSLAGVWMGFRAVSPGTELQPRWYVFYPDGQVFEDLPRGGLEDFSRAASQADPAQRPYWGRFTFDGATGAITRPGVTAAETLAPDGPGRLKVDSAPMARCPPVDGLRLDGAWTTYANPDDPELDRLPPGRAPILRLSADGRFVDAGIGTSLVATGDPRADAPGAGTYEFRTFTLILRYADGRVRRFAFTGILGADPATTNNIIYLDRSRFNKRR